DVERHIQFKLETKPR
ncbi:4Fe-4S dicluster domain protein, partial [Vibrio parahaemolyticus 3256]